MIDIFALRPILAELDLAPVKVVSELHGGSAATYRLELADGMLIVLKTYALAEMLPHRAAFAARLLEGLEVPHTRYLHLDDSMSRLPYRFALTSYVPGFAGSQFLSHPASADMFEAIGALARRLHSVPMPRFGVLPDMEHESNADYVRALAEHAFGRFLHYGADVRLTERLREVFDAEYGAAVLPDDRSVFAHDDLHPGNVLFVPTPTGFGLGGLVDFGNARASAGVMDLAKTIFICEHEKPGSGASILRGYGPIGHPEPERALAFYTLLHRVIMWWWLRHVGVLATANAHTDLMVALGETAAVGQPT